VVIWELATQHRSVVFVDGGIVARVHDSEESERLARCRMH